MQSNVLAGDKARSAASGAFAEAMSTGGTTHPGRVGDSGRHGGRRRGRGRNHRPAGSTQGRDDAPAHRAGRRPRRTRAHLSCTASASVPTHVPTRRVPRLPVAGAGIARAPRPDRTALAEPGQADHCPGRVQESLVIRGRTGSSKKIGTTAMTFPDGRSPSSVMTYAPTQRSVRVETDESDAGEVLPPGSASLRPRSGSPWPPQRWPRCLSASEPPG